MQISYQEICKTLNAKDDCLKHSIQLTALLFDKGNKCLWNRLMHTYTRSKSLSRKKMGEIDKDVMCKMYCCLSVSRTLCNLNSTTTAERIALRGIHCIDNNPGRKDSSSNHFGHNKMIQHFTCPKRCTDINELSHITFL